MYTTKILTKFLAIYVICENFVVSGKVYEKRFALPGELPYTVMLRNNFSRCSGVIVSEYWVLTAAHCLPKSPQHPIKVLAGVSDVDSYDHSDAQEINVEKFFSHPEFDGKLINDIGIIKLSKPLKFNNRVNKVRISPTGWPVNQHLVCTASGFGMKEVYIENSKMKKVVVDVFHGDDQCLCLHAMDTTTGLCHGDSGGPLVCNNTIVGVCSSTIPLTCTNVAGLCLTPTDFTTYTYLCPYLEWLAMYVPEVPQPPLSCTGCLLASDFCIPVVLVLFNYL